MAKESKHVVKFKASHLQSGESVVEWGCGYIGEMMGKGDSTQYNGALIVTGQRAVFYRKGFFGEVLETIPLKAITSIERKSFMGHRSIKLHTSHDALEFKTFDKDQEQALVSAIEAGRGSPVSAQAHAEPDAAATLKKLADLRDAGILSDDEFAAKKAELLARI